jgi:glycosyltransferase involved in cell wall biosynthesis
MITYGHEKFILDAVEGVLIQKCNFSFELIVSNDASPDKTDDIMQEIIKKHGDVFNINYSYHDNNLGMMGNFLWALNQAKGNYIAICEGDDYWTDPYKLQTQIDFLESNVDYAMCYHPVEIKMANEFDYYEYPIPQKNTLYLKDIIKHHFIPTCSLVFRNGYFPQGFPEWMKKSISGDIPLEILLASKGKTKYIPKVMACYRRNEGGISQSQIQLDNMRTGYIYMFSKLASELTFLYSLLLYKKVFMIKLSILKTKLLQKINR